jgi:hypothetical protein
MLLFHFNALQILKKNENEPEVPKMDCNPVSLKIENDASEMENDVSEMEVDENQPVGVSSKLSFHIS